MAITRPVHVYRYSDLVLPWEHADQADVSAFDLCFEIMTDYDQAPLISKTVGAGIVVSGYSATITVLAAVTGTLAAGNYVYTVSRRATPADVLSDGPLIVNPPRVGRS